VLALAVGACGDEDEEGPPETRLAAALGTVSGPEPIGTGYGWIDVERLREGPGSLRRELDWFAPALGPGGREVAGAAGSLERAGVAPLESEAMLSIATSYALALRLDGVDPARAEDALLAAGAKREDAGAWTTFDLGPEWTAALGTSLEDVGSIAARSATRPETLVLARSDLARSKMLSSDDPSIQAEPVSVATECLGDVVAARIVLNNHTHAFGTGPDLLAFGVQATESGRPREEVFCALGEADDPVDAAADSLEDAFDPDARDVVTDEPMRDIVASSEVEVSDQGAMRVARVELTTAAGEEPGFLFGAFDRGSVLTYMGLNPPPTGT
jgi:hypothetical protein